MSCRACTAAERHPRSDVLASGCMSCEARALASIGSHIESVEINVITPQYRSTLERVFGDRWRQGHELVKTWGQRISEATAREKARAK